MWICIKLEKGAKNDRAIHSSRSCNSLSYNWHLQTIHYKKPQH